VTVPLASSLLGLTLSERFLVQEKVGEELLGSVYLATDQQTGDTVHVKVLHPHLATNKEKFARFGREITATEMVKHPNTVKVVGWGQHLEMRYLVLEHVLARPLAEELEKGPMPPHRAAHIAAQVAAAVGAAHQEGIVHRNLSLHNVLLLDNAASGDFVKVRDFGLSKLDTTDADDNATHLTQAGARVGNTHYMAPEYIEANKVHPKGDVYAVGGLLYHMLTGSPPYEGRAGDVLASHVDSPVPSPSEARPGLPPWCDELVHQMMAKKTKDRPGAYRVPSMLEDAVGQSLAAPKLLRVSADGTVQRPSKAPMVAMGVAGALMLAVAAVLVVLSVLTIGGIAAYRASQVATAPVEQGLKPIDHGGAEPAMEAPPADAPQPGPAPAPRAAPAPGAAPAPAARPAPTPAPAPAAAGSVEVLSNERALVYVNGKVKGYTPLTVQLAEGDHEIAVALPGQADTRQARTVAIRKADEQTMEFRF